ncbi:MAG TPA: triose-phosphate isomerase family protein, partial [Thermoanaerobaculia bacterium]
MPNHYVIANWKMNVPPEGIDAYVSAIDNARGGPALVVAPPYTYLQRVASAFRNGAATAAQNCADHEKGAYTGEISPAMIRDTGATFVILGHSERR